jgi:uncharacterized membrane protein
VGRGREEDVLFILTPGYWTIYQNKCKVMIHYAFQFIPAKVLMGFPGFRKFQLC